MLRETMLSSLVTSAQFVDDVRLELGAIAPVEKSHQEFCRLAITQRRQ